MTQIQYVSEKEMTRQTGVRNALGYTFPKQDKILLRKGLKGKLREDVIEHEINHLKKGEEGPFIGAAIGGALSYLGSKKQAGAARDAGAMSAAQLEKAAGYYAPYRGIGEQAAGSLEDFIYGTPSYSPEQTAQMNALNQQINQLQQPQGSPTLPADGPLSIVQQIAQRGGMAQGTDNSAQINALRSQLSSLQSGARTGGAGFAAREPTMEEVMSGQGYKTRLGAIESSAAARGGLFSGNALRNIGEFGASEFERERARKQQEYQQQLTNIMGVTDIGMRAAGGSAGIAQQGATQLPSYITQAGNAMAQPYAFGAGIAGQYQAQQDWTNALNQYRGGTPGDAYMPAYPRY